MGNAIDLTGMRFGRLTVIERAQSDSPHAVWRCKCDCGQERIVIGQNLRRQYQKSCGCLDLERKTIHGAARRNTTTGEYISWKAMIQRCTNPKRRGYELYGGRGIKVCDRWLHSFENFLTDMGVRPSPKHSIERKDVNGDYTPENCHWATMSDQIANQRLRHDNTSGHKGVSWDKLNGKWFAYINRNKEKRIRLGLFDNLEDAIEARKKAEQEYHKQPS